VPSGLESNSRQFEKLEKRAESGRPSANVGDSRFQRRDREAAVKLTQRKSCIALVITLLSVSNAFSQTQWNGAWSTSPVPKGWTGWTDSGAPKTFSEPPDLFSKNANRSLNPNVFPTEVLIQFTIHGTAVSGFLGVNGVWETPMKIELGKIEGKQIRFITTTRREGFYPFYHHWLAEFTDDNTLSLRRANIEGTTGRGGSGAIRGDAKLAPPPPSVLPSLDQTHFSNPLTLHRVK
jgi:hypothetical protein